MAQEKMIMQPKVIRIGLETEKKYSPYLRVEREK